ncbi:alpha/beta hydrolase [uncultured Draconibacterium sp.]|uniref:alpha/beta fold hydrolase n=1 Tax=uncultured Draconibacterium sp. TaxID=1573823 RepID=UPI0025D5F754|nr:alpha/beta hydrolase [uncultured Draconibacterium sp.]
MKAMFLLFLLTSTVAHSQKKAKVKNGDANLNTTVYSDDKTETVLLLHGGPGVPDEMLEVVDILKKKYRVITFEQRGVGASYCKNCSYTMEDYISDIDAILEKYDITKVHLFGHSWGGLYAQIYAIERPEKIKSLFLCSTSSGTNTLWKKTEKEVMSFNRKMTSNKEWINMGWNSFLGMLGSDKAYGKVFKQVLENYYKDYSDLKLDNEFYTKIHSKPINKTRKEIRKYKSLNEVINPQFPILITYGDNDIYGESKDELPKRFPTATITTIKNSGHIPWKHNYAVFEKILVDFYNIEKPAE